jgi:aryl-alcohol dehydrogenase (NADP+)
MARDMYYRDTDFGIADRVVELAGRRGVTPSQIALAWMLHKPEVTAPIIGASKIAHLEEAVGALEIELEAEEITALEQLYEPHPVLGHR